MILAQTTYFSDMNPVSEPDIVITDSQCLAKIIRFICAEELYRNTTYVKTTLQVTCIVTFQPQLAIERPKCSSAALTYNQHKTVCATHFSLVL